MEIKLFYKQELINNIKVDFEVYNQFILAKNLTPGIGMIIAFIEEITEIDVNDYVFAKEFILNDNEIIIILKDTDYKKIIRDIKIKKIL
jgi:hypothetical protein